MSATSPCLPHCLSFQFCIAILLLTVLFPKWSPTCPCPTPPYSPFSTQWPEWPSGPCNSESFLTFRFRVNFSSLQRHLLSTCLKSFLPTSNFLSLYLIYNTSTDLKLSYLFVYLLVPKFSEGKDLSVWSITLSPIHNTSLVNICQM